MKTPRARPAAQAKRATRLWLTRDMNACCYDLWKREPHLLTSGEYETNGMSKGHLSNPCADEFQRITGLTLKPGECREVTLAMAFVPAKGKAKP